MQSRLSSDRNKRLTFFCSFKHERVKGGAFFDKMQGFGLVDWLIGLSKVIREGRLQDGIILRFEV